jgi:predicted enzyme related to lactoylglutathione lyase
MSARRRPRLVLDARHGSRGRLRQVVGLPPRRDGDDWAEFDAGPVRLGLHGAGERPALPGGGTVVLRVDDLDATRLVLEERGVVFDAHVGEVEGRARFSSFADPDGNALQIIEYMDGAS